MDENTFLWIAVAVLSILLAFRMISGGKRAHDKTKKLPGVDRLLSKGKYAQAGQLALDHDRPKEAIDYFVRAQKPARAAPIAVQIGDHRLAGELYEHAGLFDKAALSYDRAGFVDLARNARARAGAAGTDASKVRSGDLPSPEPGTTTASVPLADPARRELEGREIADRLLAAGDLRGAADVLRDAELYEEAVHLYVNVLALPSEAAPLVMKRGNFERAAELYELSGDKERAAETWITVAKKSKSPLQHLDRIHALSREKGLAFIEELANSHPLAPASAEIHYRHAVLLEARGDLPGANRVFLAMLEQLGPYKDVELKLGAPTGAKPTPRAASIPRGVAADPLDDVMLPPVDLEDGLLAPGELNTIHREAAELAQRELHALRADDARDVNLRTRTDAAVPHEGFPGRAAGVHAPTLMLLADEAVQAARAGPSVDTLKRVVEGQECTLRNIEVFYRIGLAHLAGGNYVDALSALEKVDGVSPGYRDAGARAYKIRDWQQGLADQYGELVVAGTLVRSKQKSRYTIAGELGRGAMGVVYRATDEVLGRDVALKFLHERAMSQPSLRELFQREARSVAQLNHPNVVTIYDFGMLDGQTFIAMEYVEGVTVKEICLRHSPLSLLETLRISTQLLDALEVAHKRSIIHRDIKPSNMMRTPTGLVKLMDFGLAKSTRQGTDTSMVAGTPGYMAPEQITGEQVDTRSDLFSVAVSIYEMLAGRLPFEGMDRLRTPPRLKELNGNIPRVISELVMRGISFDPDDRFQTAGAFSAPFKRILATVGARGTGDLRTADLPPLEAVAASSTPNPHVAKPSVSDGRIEPPKSDRPAIDTGYFSARRPPRG